MNAVCWTFGCCPDPPCAPPAELGASILWFWFCPPISPPCSFKVFAPFVLASGLVREGGGPIVGTIGGCGEGMADDVTSIGSPGAGAALWPIL